MPPPQVNPWLVFGIVQLELPGTGIELADIWAASVASATKGPHGLNLTVLLGGVPEADQQFDIEGTGRPGAPRIVGCRHLKPPPSQCKLQPTLRVLSEFEGIMALQIKLAVWQAGAIFSLGRHPSLSAANCGASRNATSI